MAAELCSFTPNPLKLFRQCVAAPPPSTPSTTPTLLFAAIAVATACGAFLHTAFPVHSKRHTKLFGWQRALGERLESRPVLLLVILLILTDLACTACASLVAEGELVEWAEWAGFRCLLVFLVEQLLHLVAFGFEGFFSNPWFVLDLLAVSVSALVELNDELLEGNCKLLILARLWKVAAFAFDLALVEKETEELVEESKGKED